MVDEISIIWLSRNNPISASRAKQAACATGLFPFLLDGRQLAEETNAVKHYKPAYYWTGGRQAYLVWDCGAGIAHI
jgi:hypothetical protein